MTDHDSIYHKLFGHAGMVAALLREFVPEPWLDDFDLDGITRENTKWHTRRGKRREGDTAWRIPRRNGGETYVLILLEFQSTIDRFMALRVLVYVGLLWQHLRDAKRLLPDGRLPPVLPIVLYNGEPRWAAPLSLRHLIGLPDDSPLWEWQPDIRYYMIDEGRYGEANLARREGLMALLFRLETVSDPDHLPVLRDALSAWFAANPAPERLRKLFVALLHDAIETIAPGVPVPENLLGDRTMMRERLAAWRQEADRVAEERGKLLGEEQGKQQGLASLLLRLLEQRFGALPAWVGERVAAAEPAALEEWGLRVLDAGSLDDVFA
jgi:hypothetical protein